MNNLESELYRIVDIVVECCTTTILATGLPSLTKSEVLSNSRKENACLARTILAFELVKRGFSTTTIAQLLSKTERNIRAMQTTHKHLLKSSCAYRLAVDEIEGKIKGSESEIIK